MGNRISLGREAQTSKETFPVTDRPPTFDPLAGFPRGRKVREMKATWEEMEDWKLPVKHRDYCAHLAINVERCLRDNFPIANYMCRDEHHAWQTCQFHDHLIRMKEFERERRLLKRQQRKRQTPATLQLEDSE